MALAAHTRVDEVFCWQRARILFCLKQQEAAKACGMRHAASTCTCHLSSQCRSSVAASAAAFKRANFATVLPLLPLHLLRSSICISRMQHELWKGYALWGSRQFCRVAISRVRMITINGAIDNTLNEDCNRCNAEKFSAKLMNVTISSIIEPTSRQHNFLFVKGCPY